LVVQLAGANHCRIANGVNGGDAAKSDAERAKALLKPPVCRVDAVVMVAMHRYADPHGLRQGVQEVEAVRVIPRGLMGDEYICAKIRQVIDVLRVDGSPVLAVGTFRPAVLAWG
jgi:hypothetical protein